MSEESGVGFGLHERLSTPTLREKLRELGLEELARWRDKLSVEDLEPAVAAHLGRLFTRLSLALREKDHDQWGHALGQFAGALQSAGNPFEGLAGEVPVPPFEQLLEVVTREAGVLGKSRSIRPDVPLGVSALLTGAGRTPSLISQIQKELASTDRADWLVNGSTGSSSITSCWTRRTTRRRQAIGPSWNMSARGSCSA